MDPLLYTKNIQNSSPDVYSNMSKDVLTTPCQRRVYAERKKETKNIKIPNQIAQDMDIINIGHEMRQMFSNINKDQGERP